MLEVSQVSGGYGRAQVLHSVSVRIERGEMVFIVGRNGAGKTTLLKIISGLIKPSSGQILLEGKEIKGMSPVKLARMGLRYVAQDKKVFGSLTVRGNIELAAYSSGVNMSSAIERVLSIYPTLNRV